MSGILIKGASIVDGNNTKPYMGDLLIKDGKIAEIAGDLPDADAFVIDAAGLTAAPGFIDGHTHNELDILRDRQRVCALTQGITTEVVGQCGLGAAPSTPENLESMIRLYSGIYGEYSPHCHNWGGFGDFLSRLDGAAVNVASPAAHSALRANAVGFSAKEADSADIAKMCSDMSKAMQEGAVGFSTGLTYYPAGYGNTEELIAICRVVKEHDGIFLVHKRDNLAIPRDSGAGEAARIIRETKVRAHILHYKTGPGNAGNIASLLAPYQSALDSGCDISFEYYPYHAGAGFGIVFLPPWAMEGGYTAVMERLSDRLLRQKLAEDAQKRYDILVNEDGATFTALENTPEYEGKTFDEVCSLRSRRPVEMILDILLENKLAVGFRGNPPQGLDMSPLEDDFFSMLDMPNYTVGSDSISYGRYAHPRAFGSFTKLLRLSREKNYPIEKLVHKITKYSADRYRLAGKGVLSPGMDADICVFDYNTVRDNATFDRPRRMSAGMRYVIVNGLPAVEEGQATGVFAGRALKRA